MSNIQNAIVGKKIGNVRIMPVVIKIITIFTLFLLVSNLASNYINLMANRAEQIKLMKQLIVKDLKQIYDFNNNQFQIYEFEQNLEKTVKAIEGFCVEEFNNQKSIALGIKPDGTFFFQALKESEQLKRQESFTDQKTLAVMTQNLADGVKENTVNFTFNNDEYFGVYKYYENWNIFLLRAEELNEFYQPTTIIFIQISIIIVVIAIASALVGVYLVQHTMRYINIITNSLMNMQQNQRMDLIDLEGATSDDITYLGVSFNALSSTINNLVSIFRKFVTKDVAYRAYREKQIRLEGSQKELTILFSDIKSFTFITETLGTDIIRLLNLHYDKAINSISKHDGIVGSIIGDAILAVYGTLTDSKENKSIEAIRSAYEIQEAAATLRQDMFAKKETIKKQRGSLTEPEEKLFKAVLLEVGVGIDGGNVFYGNIGSNERMTNTVIGDNVNSASRLEGLTRIYKVPVICSDFVKEEIERDVSDSGLKFVELDQVQVKGKTIGKRIFWPVLEEQFDADLEKEVKAFSNGLQLYYEGDWKSARNFFNQCTLPLVDVFKERTKYKCPDEWSGIWTMKTK